MLRVAICVPTRGNTSREFTFSLVSMCMTTAAEVPGLETGVLFGENTYIHRNRNDLARMALDSGATHLLWLDDDMEFPIPLLVRLLKHKKPIVGVNYVTRCTHPEPVTILSTGTGGTPPARLWTTPTDAGLVPVDAVGFGAVLIQSQVFEKVPEPWFENYYVRKEPETPAWAEFLAHAKRLGLTDYVAATSPRGPFWVGEDADFCAKARQVGFEVLVDQDLSKEIGHIDRKFVYTHDHALAVKDEPQTEEAPVGT